MVTAEMVRELAVADWDAVIVRHRHGVRVLDRSARNFPGDDKVIADVERVMFLVRESGGELSWLVGDGAERIAQILNDEMNNG